MHWAWGGGVDVFSELQSVQHTNGLVRLRLSQEQWNTVWSELPPQDRVLDTGTEEAKQGWQVLHIKCLGALLIFDGNACFPQGKFLRLLDDLRTKNINSLSVIQTEAFRIRAMLVESGTGVWRGTWENHINLFNQTFGSAWYGNLKPTHMFGHTELIRRFLYSTTDRMLRASKEGSKLSIHQVQSAGYGACYLGMNLWILDELPENELLFANIKDLNYQPDGWKCPVGQEPRFHGLIVFDDFAAAEAVPVTRPGG